MPANINVDHSAMAVASNSHKNIGAQIADISSDLQGAMTSDDAFGKLWYSYQFSDTYHQRLQTAQECLRGLGEATQNHGYALSLNDTAFTDADNQSGQTGQAFSAVLDGGVT